MRAAAISPVWRLLAIGASLAALLLASYTAGLITRDVFAQPNGNVIHACKGDRSGSLRVVSGPGDCLRGESPLSWTQHGATGYQVVSEETVLSSGSFALLDVFCPANHVALGGGITLVSGTPLTMDVITSAPDPIGTSWRAFVRHLGVSSDPIRVGIYATCANFGS